MLPYAQPCLWPVLTLGGWGERLHPGVGTGCIGGLGRITEGGKVGSRACQGLRNMNGGITLSLDT